MVLPKLFAAVRETQAAAAPVLRSSVLVIKLTAALMSLLLGTMTPAFALLLASAVPFRTADAVQADIIETRTPALK